MVILWLSQGDRTDTENQVPGQGPGRLSDVANTGWRPHCERVGVPGMACRKRHW